MISVAQLSNEDILSLSLSFCFLSQPHLFGLEKKGKNPKTLYDFKKIARREKPLPMRKSSKFTKP
ncbi:MAG: hypothetical protein Ct9H300mP23_09190 [Nitrospinota bacterium]|nr:MAG: hypothetical protein Ct9H300mP23_09190 [Nitrospinota bacterium]